jgi:MFS family permease
MSGMRMLPMMVGMLTTSIVSGRLISRIGRYKWFVVSGTAILAGAIGIMTTITITTSAWALVGMLFLVGFGLGLFMQVLILSVQNSIPFEYMGTGTASVTFFRTLGGAIGAAVLGAVLILQEKTHAAHYVHTYGAVKGLQLSFTHGMDQAFMYAVPVAVLAFVLSFLLREVKLRALPGTDSGEGMGLG